MELAGGEQLPSGKWVFDPSIGVRKGEKGKAVCFWGVGKDRRDDDKAFRFLKWYVVFSAEQIDGLPEKFFPQPAAPVAPVIRDARVDEYVAETKANIRHGGASAYYIPSQDFIQSPPPEDFDDMAAYYGTLLHELGHWTGHADRLDRFTPSGSAAQEELVAEMSASFLGAHLGIEPTVREDHAQYIASWIAHLQDDKTALRKACAAAQRVVDFLDGLQPKEEEKAA
jgi:antirestriction protein ArdC